MGRSTINADIRYRYTGQENDAEIASLFYNFRARMFDGNHGIFYSPDPANSTYSRYGYAKQNRVNFIDPTGLLDLYTTWLYKGGMSSLQEQSSRMVMRPGGPSRTRQFYRDWSDFNMDYDLSQFQTGYEMGRPDASLVTLSTSISGRALDPYLIVDVSNQATTSEWVYDSECNCNVYETRANRPNYVIIQQGSVEPLGLDLSDIEKAQILIGTGNVAYDFHQRYMQTSPVPTARSATKAAPKARSVGGALGRLITGAAVVSTLYDARVNGLKPHHVADLFLTGAVFALDKILPGSGVVAGSALLISDVAFYNYTGRSMTEFYFDPSSPGYYMWR